MTAPLLRVRDLKVHFPIRAGVLQKTVGAVRAVDGVSFDVYPGETLGLVGESGSGKSTTGRSILQLERPTAGSVMFRDEELTALSGAALRARRRHMQMIFQDPYASLNPQMTVATILREPLDVHRLGTSAERDARVAELLERVGLGPGAAHRHPAQFSGGQRQRVGIARALATQPEFIVADEPISALDVSIQAQVVNLMADLKAELGLTYLFIAHDLSMVRHISDRVAVMYLGRIVELGPTDDIFYRARHPYTQALISAIPSIRPDAGASEAVPPLKGDMPSPANPPPGCRFHTRCPLATELCRQEDPALLPVATVVAGHGPSHPPAPLGTEDAGHVVACHHAEPATARP